MALNDFGSCSAKQRGGCRRYTPEKGQAQSSAFVTTRRAGVELLKGPENSLDLGQNGGQALAEPLKR